MNIEDLTIKQIRELKSLLGDDPQPDCPYEVGLNYFIRTVTHHYTGRLVRVFPGELVLTDAAWIADDGRFMEAMRDGTFNEVEPWPDGRQVIVHRGGILDATAIPFKLPREQK